MKIKITFFLLIISQIFMAQVGIGGNPDASAQLDVSSTNKGIIIPRVPLGSVTDNSLDGGTTTVVEGLTIYNTNENVAGGNGKGFYYYNGSKWMKLIPQSDNIAVVPIDTGQYTLTSTSGMDIPGYDSAFEPIFFNKDGNLQIKLIVRYSSIQGDIKFQLRAHDDTTNSFPIVYGDFGVFGHTQNGGVATSDWKNWNAGTHAHEIHLFAWVQSGNTGDHVTIESAYLLVRSQ